MKLKRIAGWSLIVVAVWLVVAVMPAFAQCPMCKAAVAGSENPGELANALDAGTALLFFPTMAIIGMIAGLVLKFRHAHGSELSGQPERQTRIKIQDETPESHQDNYGSSGARGWSPTRIV